jgi:hypothetical protein
MVLATKNIVISFIETMAVYIRIIYTEVLPNNCYRKLSKNNANMKIMETE